MARHKLTQRPSAKRTPRRRVAHHRDAEVEGLRNKEVCAVLGMTSGNVAKAANAGRLDRHEDGSYTRASVRAYAQDVQGKSDVVLPEPEPGSAVMIGELVPVTTKGHAPMSRETVQALELQHLQAQVKDREYAALLRELAYQRELGEMIPREQMEQTVQQAFAQVRDALLNLAGRLTPELTGLDDEADVYRRLNAETRRMITGLQRSIENLR